MGISWHMVHAKHTPLAYLTGSLTAATYCVDLHDTPTQVTLSLRSHACEQDRGGNGLDEGELKEGFSTVVREQRESRYAK